MSCTPVAYYRNEHFVWLCVSFMIPAVPFSYIFCPNHRNKISIGAKTRPAPSTNHLRSGKELIFVLRYCAPTMPESINPGNSLLRDTKNCTFMHRLIKEPAADEALHPPRQTQRKKKSGSNIVFLIS